MAKNLIIYFSRADENYSVGYVDKGNTEIVAEKLSALINADMFKVEPLKPYAKDYTTCIQEAKIRLHNAPIKDNITDVSIYDTIYVMTPIYWGTYAPELETCLSSLNLNGKKVRVITTHEGSGLGTTIEDLKKICRGADVDENGLAIVGHEVNECDELLKGWI